MSPITDQAYHAMLEVMEAFSALSPGFKISLKAALQQTTLPGGKQLLNTGQTQTTLYFLLSGIARETREEANSLNDKTTWFFLPGSFLFTEPGLFAREPSATGIQLLQDSSLITLSFQDWRTLKSKFPEAETLSERIRSQHAKLRQHHAEENKFQSTQERYILHKEQLEQLLMSVKLKLVAEYMGMAPDTLGRLRRKFSRRR